MFDGDSPSAPDPSPVRITRLRCPCSEQRLFSAAQSLGSTREQSLDQLAALPVFDQPVDQLVMCVAVDARRHVAEPNALPLADSDRAVVRHHFAAQAEVLRYPLWDHVLKAVGLVLAVDASARSRLVGHNTMVQAAADSYRRTDRACPGREWSCFRASRAGTALVVSHRTMSDNQPSTIMNTISEMIIFSSFVVMRGIDRDPRSFSCRVPHAPGKHSGLIY